MNQKIMKHLMGRLVLEKSFEIPLTFEQGEYVVEVQVLVPFKEGTTFGQKRSLSFSVTEKGFTGL